MSKNYKTYYGEFSLKQWIDMILKKEIILPEYQRSFVWKSQAVERLIESLEEESIIPPVIIAQKKGKNLLIDGQQRLSSILLSYLSIFPKEKKEVVTTDENVNVEVSQYNSNEGTSNAEEEEYVEKTTFDDTPLWTFTHIQNQFNALDCDINKLLEVVKKDPLYTVCESINRGPNFYNTHFMGYALSVRLARAESDEHKHFSKVFHAINTSSSPLSQHEARRSFYWLEPGLEKILEPDFTTKIIIAPEVGNPYLIEFVRPLSFAVNYHAANKNLHLVARGFSGKYEEYMTGFVKRYADQDPDNLYPLFGNIKEILPPEIVSRRIEYLSEMFSPTPPFFPKFKAAFEYDYYFFGLVYWTIVCGKKINLTDSQNFTISMKKHMEQFIQENDHNSKKYNYVTKIRRRLDESIKIYEQYIEGDIDA